MTEFGKTVVSLNGVLPQVLEEGAMLARLQSGHTNRELWFMNDREAFAVYTYAWKPVVFSTVGRVAGPFTAKEILLNYPEFGAYEEDTCT